MENKLISVIVPVYNVEKYLNRCIDSIIGQTYKNLEIILVDDGSPDNSGKICDEYAKRDSRIKVFHKANGGLSSARNYGIEKSSGDFIGFIDSDDYIDNVHYEKLVCRLLEDDSEFSCCNYTSYKNGHECSFIENASLNKDEIEKDVIPSLLGFKSTKNIYVGLIAAWNKLFKKSFLINNKLYFNEKIFFAEDYAFALLCLKHANKISILNDCTYFYCFNASSMTKSFRNNYFLEEINIRIFIEENFKNYNWTNLDKQRSLKNIWERSSVYYSSFLSIKKLKAKFSLMFDYYNKYKIYEISAENYFELKLKKNFNKRKEFIRSMLSYNKKTIFRTQMKRLMGRVKWKMD